MDRFAVLVDAGYLLSQGVQILSGQRSKYRRNIAITDPEGLIAKIVERSIAVLGNPNLLRVYWYDGVSGKLSAEQEALSRLADVQLRQGTISRSGVQKGVDSKIIADLIELSSNHAMSDAVLVTGDGDLVIGIELAQKRGVRVGVLGIEDAELGVPHNQSFEVVCIADRVLRLSKSDIAPYLSYLPSAATAATRIAATEEPEESRVVPPPSVPAKKVAATKAVAKTAAPKKAAAKKTAAKKAATKTAVPKAEAAKKPPGSPKTTKAPALPAAAPKTRAESVALSLIVEQFIATAEPPFTDTTVTPTGAIGQAVDGKLLQAATAALGRRPMPSERTELRNLFREKLMGNK